MGISGSPPARIQPEPSVSATHHRPAALYTAEQRARRDRSAWTMVQAVLAPLQFVVFLVSLGFVVNWLATGEGYGLAVASIVIKTVVLYTIMITGAVWEREVFGVWLFAPAFFWEDVVSILVLALHSLYLIALVAGWWSPTVQVAIALAGYAAYVVNAAQFLWKLRMARLQAGPRLGTRTVAEGAS